jgi:hypothetical protein
MSAGDKGMVMFLFLVLARTADSIVSFWLFGAGLGCLWEGNNFEASALIIAGVFWQRAWKSEMIKSINEAMVRAKQEATK